MFDTASVLSEPAPGLGRAAAWAGLGLHQLRYVLAAAEHRGFRRAARSLGVQQSAVSRRIQDLEARLGGPIFERGPHGVQLTPAGVDFVRSAQQAMLQLDEAVDVVAEAAREEAGVLRIGILGALGGVGLDSLLTRFLARGHAVQFDLKEGSAEILTEALRRGRLDLAFLSAPPSDLVCHRAWRERLVLALPANHPLAARAALDRRDLADLAIKAPRVLVSGLLANGGWTGELAGRLEVQDASAQSLVRLTALGQGCALIVEGAATRMSGVVYRPIQRARMTFSAVLGRRPEKPCVRRLLALLPAA